MTGSYDLVSFVWACWTEIDRCGCSIGLLGWLAGGVVRAALSLDGLGELGLHTSFFVFGAGGRCDVVEFGWVREWMGIDSGVAHKNCFL